mgnify:CR=1 FL=1
MLKDKVALITGAARGIGRHIAICFAQQGCNIAFTDLAETEQSIQTLHDIESLGVQARFYVSNAADFQAAHETVAAVQRDLGHIDILVNNAGITRDTLIMRMSEEQWDTVLAVNLKSAFNFIHAVTPIMLRQRSGSIISMSSVVGLNGNAGQANYAASKAGIIALTKSTAKELGSRSIRANAIAPGFILTDMTAALSEDTLKQFTDRIPMHRGGTPEEVAKVALFLASDLSSYVSGQVIQVNGAMV